MVTCHSCHIYRISRSKEVGGHFKVIIWDGNASYKKGTILMGKGDSYYVILLCWNFIVSLIRNCKIVYRILPVFLILLLFYLFCIYEIDKAKSTIQSVLKFVTLTLNYSVWLFLPVHISIRDTNIFAQSQKNTFIATENL